MYFTFLVLLLFAFDAPEANKIMSFTITVFYLYAGLILDRDETGFFENGSVVVYCSKLKVSKSFNLFLTSYYN